MKKRKTVKKRYVIALVIVIAGLITLWRILNAPVPTYQTLIVRPGDLQQSVLATGKLDALRKVDVGAQVSGQLKTLSVAIGDKVKKDQLLGVIDPEQAENQIKEVEATLMELRAQRQQAEAELKLARVTYSRQQRLAQTQAVSQQDLDTAATEMAVKQAQIGTIDAQIKRNQASLDTAKTNLDYTRIVAPMAGEVTQITTLQGQTVIAAQQAPNILTLADMSTMLVKAQVSEADVPVTSDMPAADTPEEKSMVSSAIPQGKPTDYVRISSPFGTRIHPITRKKHTHKGIDLAAPKMTPIYATADGKVTFSGRNGGYGNFVKLNHLNGYKTAYAHMHRIAVDNGDYVHKGDLIGYVGTTGSSTGNHLHYEVYYEDNLIDPATTL